MANEKAVKMWSFFYLKGLKTLFCQIFIKSIGDLHEHNVLKADHTVNFT